MYFNKDNVWQCRVPLPYKDIELLICLCFAERCVVSTDVSLLYWRDLFIDYGRHPFHFNKIKRQYLLTIMCASTRKKIMVKTYCIDNEKDLGEGITLFLFADRESVQESLGFSPF